MITTLVLLNSLICWLFGVWAAAGYYRPKLEAARQDLAAERLMNAPKVSPRPESEPCCRSATRLAAKTRHTPPRSTRLVLVEREPTERLPRALRLVADGEEQA